MRVLGLSVVFAAGCALADPVTEEAPSPLVPPLSSFSAMAPTALELSAADIIAKAHAAAGGEAWVRPGSLFLRGYNVMHRGEIAEGGTPDVYDQYAMWRVYADEKADAHAANGKVRIEAWTGETLRLLLTFDGEATYTQNGRMPPSAADAQWSNSFGFGAIRNALDEGWTQRRLPDDFVDGRAAHFVELSDPAGGVTHFGIAMDDFAILSVGFDTPRGWHERRYSDFFTKPGVSWVQPGRVRLFYDGVKANEAVWTDFEVGGVFPDEAFVVETAPSEPTF